MPVSRANKKILFFTFSIRLTKVTTVKSVKNLFHFSTSVDKRGPMLYNYINL